MLAAAFVLPSRPFSTWTRVPVVVSMPNRTPRRNSAVSERRARGYRDMTARRGTARHEASPTGGTRGDSGVRFRVARTPRGPGVRGRDAGNVGRPASPHRSGAAGRQRAGYYRSAPRAREPVDHVATPRDRRVRPRSRLRRRAGGTRATGSV